MAQKRAQSTIWLDDPVAGLSATISVLICLSSIIYAGAVCNPFTDGLLKLSAQFTDSPIFSSWPIGSSQLTTINPKNAASVLLAFHMCFHPPRTSLGQVPHISTSQAECSFLVGLFEGGANETVSCVSACKHWRGVNYGTADSHLVQLQLKPRASVTPALYGCAPVSNGHMLSRQKWE